MFGIFTRKYYEFKFSLDKYINRKLKKDEISELDKFLTVMGSNC